MSFPGSHAAHGIAHLLGTLEHKVTSGNRAQLKYEKKMAIVHLLMGGPFNAMGGTGKGKQMSWRDANSIAHDAVYNRMKHPRH